MFASLTAQALLDALDGIAYIVDEDGRIVAVGRNGWDDFARANGGEAIAGSSVIGRSLFEFVAGPEVQEHLRGYLNPASRMMAIDDGCLPAAMVLQSNRAVKEMLIN